MGEHNLDAGSRDVNVEVFNHGQSRQHRISASKLSEEVNSPESISWVRLNQDDEALLHDLAEMLDLHELAVEDAFESEQRIKVDDYEAHSFLLTYAIIDSSRLDLERSSVAIFISPHAIVTVVDVPEVHDRIAERVRQHAKTISSVRGVLYRILDTITDGYLNTLETLDQRVDEIEEALFEAVTDEKYDPGVAKTSLQSRHSVALLRRIINPMRHVTNALIRDDTFDIEPELAPYYRDLNDQVLRASEQADTAREALNIASETILTLQGQRLNVISKKVTGWAAIIAVPAAIAGFYGMNVPFPGADTPEGFLWAVGVMVAASVGLYALFKRRDWL